MTIQGLQGVGSAAESVTLSGGSSLVSERLEAAMGDEWPSLSKSLTMDGPDTTINASTTDVGRGGDIVVSVQHASLSGGATIKTLTGSGDPNAPAAATVTVQGCREMGSMADSVALSGFGSGIVSEPTGSARSGDVAVHAKTVSLTDGAVIQTGTLDKTAAGGDVTINAGSVDISGGSGIASLASKAMPGR